MHEEKHKKLEDTVIRLSLNKKHDPHGIYMKQYENAKILSRKFTGVGFFTEFIIPDELILSEESKDFCVVTGHFNDTEALQLFVIFINKGKLDMLEGFVTYDDWRYDYENMRLVLC